MHSTEVSGKRFTWVTILNLLITIFEIVGGLLSGSLALLSDAFHNLGDSISILMGYVAQVIGKRPESQSSTFGYKRAEIISAFLNALFLIVISVFLIVEAIKRLNHPQTIDGPIMLVVAVIGLLANFVSAILLRSGSHSNLNIRATYLHILSDALSSVGVIIGGLIITFTKITWVDPLITILVAIYICFEAYPIIVKAVKILMQSSPNIDYSMICKDLREIPGIVSVHHIHAWMMDENQIVFSMHINVSDMLISDLEPIYTTIEDLLKDKYHINHVTIQAEVQRGLDEQLFNIDGHRRQDHPESH
jgi:cobalt-zinc-cadmium efflux system protein